MKQTEKITPDRRLQKSKSRHGSNEAFTLVELLTVIAIIGILAAIIIPTVGKVRESARSAQCISNLRQIYAAVLLYTTDYKDRLPGPVYTNQTPYFKSGIYALSRYLENYLPVQKLSDTESYSPLFACPAWVAAGGPDLATKTAYHLNNLPWRPDRYSGPGGSYDVRPFGDQTQPTVPVRLTPRTLSSLAEYPLSKTWMISDVDKELGDTLIRGLDWKEEILKTPAHRNSHNILFYDGHVAKVSVGQFPEYP